MEQVENIDEWIATIESNGGVSIFDYSRVFTNEEFFGDRSHLNFQGTLELLEVLESDGLFAIR